VDLGTVVIVALLAGLAGGVVGNDPISSVAIRFQ